MKFMHNSNVFELSHTCLRFKFKICYKRLESLYIHHCWQECGIIIDLELSYWLGG